jgi:hypothetical protein
MGPNRCPAESAIRANQSSQLSESEPAARASCPTQQSDPAVSITSPGQLSESAARSTCPSQPSESNAQASRAGPRPASADQVDYPSQLIELATPTCRLHQLSYGASRAGPDRPGRPNQSSESVIQCDRRSPSSVVAVQLSHPSQSSKSAVHAGRPSQPSESADRVSCPSQSSGSVVRVHQSCLSSESAVHDSHPEWLTTSSPDRESTSVERVEQELQPTGGAVSALSPALRPVDPRQLRHRKRPGTVSARHTFDTNDPLQEPTRKRQRTPSARDNDLWTQWRN